MTMTPEAIELLRWQNSTAAALSRAQKAEEVLAEQLEANRKLTGVIKGLREKVKELEQRLGKG